uniref:Uncharacterized protein n=1 Tax=Panagrolaimus davidi TaxID=227884 RepID=A0A914PAT7_9BILA
MRNNLSLQTASYENSMESRTDTFGKSKKENLNKKEINFNSNISFKFPKQQENDELKEPEIAQFKASENLINPYKLITSTKIEDENKIISESQNECLSEFHKKISTILDAISPHFITIRSFEQIFQNFYQMPLNACLKDSDAKEKEKYFKLIPNIKIEKLYRGIFISSNLKPAENGFERILTTFEAMEILKGNNKKQKRTVADLQKKFYGRK